MRPLLTTLLTVTLAAALAPAADWPQFLGPDRTGISPEKGIARSWPAGGPKVLWKDRLGAGFAGPSISEGKVYLVDRDGNEADIVRCWDLANGRELWRHRYDAPGRLGHNGSRAQPTVDEKYVFTVGPFGHFTCFDKATHPPPPPPPPQPLWKKNLLDDYDSKRPNWGVAQSPVLYRQTVIAAPLGRSAGVVAFDRRTGREVWKSQPLGKMEYSSPLLTTIDGVDQVVMLSDRGRMSGLDASNGRLLWTFRQWKCGIPIPSPIAIGDGRLFMSAGYGAGSVMFRVRKAGGRFTAEKLFSLKAPGSIIHNALLYDGHLYVKHNNKKTAKGMMCLDLDGKVLWGRGEAAGYDFGNMLIADGLVFNMDGKTGKLRLIEATPARYNVLAEAQIFPGGQTIWAPMALSDGRLVLRDYNGQIKCLDVRAPDQP